MLRSGFELTARLLKSSGRYFERRREKGRRAYMRTRREEEEVCVSSGECKASRAVNIRRRGLREILRPCLICRARPRILITPRDSSRFPGCCARFSLGLSARIKIGAGKERKSYRVTLEAGDLFIFMSGSICIKKFRDALFAACYLIMCPLSATARCASPLLYYSSEDC